MDYYIEWDCPNCDETNYYGVIRTYLEHKGLPAVSLTMGAQQSYTCEHCGKTCYSGDFDLIPEDEL